MYLQAAWLVTDHSLYKLGIDKAKFIAEDRPLSNLGICMILKTDIKHTESTFLFLNLLSNVKCSGEFIAYAVCETKKNNRDARNLCFC